MAITFNTNENLDKLFSLGYEAVIFFDTETTGLDCTVCQIIELAAIRVESSGSHGAVITGQMDDFILLPNGVSVPEKIKALTHITDEMISKEGISEEATLKKFLDLSSGKVLFCAYNAQFDICFLEEMMKRNWYWTGGYTMTKASILDPLSVFRDRKDKPHKLETAINYYHLDGQVQNSHRAIDDVMALYAVVRKMTGERDDLNGYVNLFGYQPRFGVPKHSFPNIKYIAQSGGYASPDQTLPARDGRIVKSVSAHHPEEKWMVYNKRADFYGIGQRFGIDPVIARVIRNRDHKEDEDIRKYLYGGTQDLYDPHLLKDADLLTDILAQKIREKKPIRIIGDYDIDGVMSTYILHSALLRCGAVVSHQIPDRIIDGYGLNINLIKKACEDGIDTILTCDNGIAAMDEIAYAKEQGLTVLVTDHHEIPFDMKDGVKVEKKSMADAVVNTHQMECPYPNKDLCGAAVAWKVVQVLYEKMQIPVNEADIYLENVAFATVGDVMDLTDENRILVKEGLYKIHHTSNKGMLALLQECNVAPEAVNAYHFGFVIGPCVNATGRLETAEAAVSLFLDDDDFSAMLTAEKLYNLNEERKQLTQDGLDMAVEQYEKNHYDKDMVIVIYLPTVHESIAGIIAGRIRELYGKPSLVFTDAQKGGAKGSGRSIEAYSMYEELCKCSSLMTKFGGHPMAAGISLPRENIDLLRKALNENCTLTKDVLAVKVSIDAVMPMSYVTEHLIDQLSFLEPFGKANPRPLFAEKDLRILKMQLIGKNRNVLKLDLGTDDMRRVSAIRFGDGDQMVQYLTDRFGIDEVNKAFTGHENKIRIAVVYQPTINEFRDLRTIQFDIRYYR